MEEKSKNLQRQSEQEITSIVFFSQKRPFNFQQHHYLCSMRIHSFWLCVYAWSPIDDGTRRFMLSSSLSTLQRVAQQVHPFIGNSAQYAISRLLLISKNDGKHRVHPQVPYEQKKKWTIDCCASRQYDQQCCSIDADGDADDKFWHMAMRFPLN